MLGSGFQTPAFNSLAPRPTPTPTTTPLQARVHGTGAAGLIVRDQPVGRRIGQLGEGAQVIILSGPRPSADPRNPTWWEVQGQGVRGWVSERFLELPEKGR
jgi:hypothetical protein